MESMLDLRENKIGCIHNFYAFRDYGGTIKFKICSKCGKENKMNDKIKMTFYCSEDLRKKIVAQMTDPKQPGATITEVCENNLAAHFASDKVFADMIETLDGTISLTEQRMARRHRRQTTFYYTITVLCVASVLFSLWRIFNG